MDDLWLYEFPNEDLEVELDQEGIVVKQLQ